MLFDIFYTLYDIILKTMIFRFKKEKKIKNQILICILDFPHRDL